MNQQNSGKASILCEATKFLKDVFGQIESLRKEQTALLSESNYVRHFPLNTPCSPLPWNNVCLNGLIIVLWWKLWVYVVNNREEWTQGWNISTWDRDLKTTFRDRSKSEPVKTWLEHVPYAWVPSSTVSPTCVSVFRTTHFPRRRLSTIFCNSSWCHGYSPSNASWSPDTRYFRLDRAPADTSANGDV